MGQHSAKPSSRPNPERQAPNKRRWVTVAAGAAVVAAASTTAWAAVANDDAPKITTALDVAPSPTYTRSDTPSKAAKTPQPNKPSSAAPKPTALPKAAAAQPETKPVQKAKTVPVRKAKTEAAKPKTRVISSGTCGASFYDEGQMTASGERFNPSALTAAHKTLPLGSRVRVTNPANGDSVTVRINDRGPYVGGRCLDLSAAAFSAIGNTGSGVMRVKYEVLGRS
ncbi:septal ring lytic transglycosylase RlpA family protein [Nonomuraea sp. NEAU-A123]|uniref:septal ring lytic transglycosylase RlpA family protein n=1 Tax=Nonomuraea sp. NEAU-A123 TaxID=2839649 RepID=UPI001BE496CE|nr:septal ring lytic transglycosylase RlpA family protein [Nonomuraea sp. NEAU-A123]MBT2226618.1 septal ring lytic transglycosylase RlpA family protein [Nonomuraea sp. NEAU-A123]